MSEKDNVRVCDEIGNMLLLDFLRKYRGSPAISTLTIRELFDLYHEAVGKEVNDFIDLGIIHLHNETLREEGQDNSTDALLDHSGDVDAPAAEPAMAVNPTLTSDSSDEIANTGLEVFEMSRVIEEQSETVGVEGSGSPDLSGNIDLDPYEAMVADDLLFDQKNAPPPEYQSEVDAAARDSEADLQHPDSTDAVKPASPEYACFQGDPASLVKRTESAVETPVVPPATPAVQDKIIWKLKSDPSNYIFPSFELLRRWASNLPNFDLALISIDNGKTWKAFGEVMAIINASGGRLTPLKAFDVAEQALISKETTVASESSEIGRTCACGTDEDDLKIAPHLCECGCGELNKCKFPLDTLDNPESLPNQPAEQADLLEQPGEVDSSELESQDEVSADKDKVAMNSDLPPSSVREDYHWKLKAPNGMSYDFPTLESLSLWVNDSGYSGEECLVSSNGETWIAYSELLAGLESAESSAPESTPMADVSPDSSEQSIELDSQEVSDESSEDMESLDDEPTGSDSNQPEVSNAPAVTVVNEILWKLRGEGERIYEFHGFAALQQGVSNLPDAPDKVYISLDGKEWKAYAQVNDLVINGVRLRDAYEVATPIRFRKPNLNTIYEEKNK